MNLMILSKRCTGSAIGFLGRRAGSDWTLFIWRTSEESVINLPEKVENHNHMSVKETIEIKKV